MCEKKSHFLHICSFTHTLDASVLELNRVPGVLLEPYMSQGGQGSAELPMVLKGLRRKVDSNKIQTPENLNHPVIRTSFRVFSVQIGQC